MEPTRRAYLRWAFVSGAVLTAASCASGPSGARDASTPARSSPGLTPSSVSGRGYDQRTVGRVTLRGSVGSPLEVLERQVATGWRWATQAWPGVTPPARVVVWAPEDDADFRAWGGDTSESGVVAAVARADGSVLLDPGLSHQVTSDGVSVVLAHEFSHVLLHQQSDQVTPRWLIEGSAQWAAFGRTGRTLAQLVPLVRADIRAGTMPKGPPSDAAFGAASGLEHTYELAYVWCRYLVSRTGVTAWRQLVESGPVTPARLAQTVRAWTGMATGREDPAYRRFLVREFT